jgi:hypothetical protein
MLLKGDVDEIQSLLGSMKREIKSIEKEIAGLVYYANGGLAYETAYALSFDQMMIITEVINEHYEKQNEAFKQSKNR